MAYKYSDLLDYTSSGSAGGNTYQLGDYTFEVFTQDVSAESITTVWARCYKDGQIVTQKGKSFPINSDIKSWWIEANSTTADVWAVVNVAEDSGEMTSDLDFGQFSNKVTISDKLECSGSWKFSSRDDLLRRIEINLKDDEAVMFTVSGVRPASDNFENDFPNRTREIYIATKKVNSRIPYEYKQRDTFYNAREYYPSSDQEFGPYDTTVSAGASYTFNGKQVFYGKVADPPIGPTQLASVPPSTRNMERFAPYWYCIPESFDLGEFESSYDYALAHSQYLGKIAWTAVYGNTVPIFHEEQVLIARFVIDVSDADGTGPDSDWTDPDDTEPDGDPDDPTHTLHLTVTGALSGRHADPLISSPWTPYAPTAPAKQSQYGSGGIGGNGGGGGPGASTTIIRKFATDRASSKELAAIARRHGYGSGGGKGGKGGDGCILIYY